MKNSNLLGALFLASLITSCATAPTGPSAPPSSSDDERILSFHSDIDVHQDGRIDVVETITVRAKGSIIKRGIYRDLAKVYRDDNASTRELEYEPLSLLCNGATEDFHSDDSPHRVRTYFGNANRMLKAGIHTYTFRYRANSSFGYADEYDELVWHVTGRSWSFPTERASATVALKFGDNTTIRSAAAFTGDLGAPGEDYITRQEDPATVTLESRNALAPGEGLTIIVTWPKANSTVCCSKLRSNPLMISVSNVR